jgi:hypothetical protein
MHLIDMGNQTNVIQLVNPKGVSFVKYNTRTWLREKVEKLSFETFPVCNAKFWTQWKDNIVLFSLRNWIHY